MNVIDKVASERINNPYNDVTKLNNSYSLVTKGFDPEVNSLFYIYSLKCTYMYVGCGKYIPVAIDKFSAKYKPVFHNKDGDPVTTIVSPYHELMKYDKNKGLLKTRKAYVKRVNQVEHVPIPVNFVNRYKAILYLMDNTELFSGYHGDCIITMLTSIMIESEVNRYNGSIIKLIEDELIYQLDKNLAKELLIYNDTRYDLNELKQLIKDEIKNKVNT